MYSHQRSKQCSLCGGLLTDNHVCFGPPKSDYGKGYLAGLSSFILSIDNSKACLLCGLDYTDFHDCPRLYSEYDRGYAAGRVVKRREMGLPGNYGIFENSGV